MMHHSRSAEYLTTLSGVKTTPKWSFNSKTAYAHKEDTPGPGAYSLTSVDKGKYTASKSYGFGTSPRETVRGDSSPGPGQYTFDRTHSGSGTKVGFGTAQRLGRRGFVQERVPGPGAYNHSERMGTEGIKYSVRSALSNRSSAETPGPGSYHTPTADTCAAATNVARGRSPGAGSRARASSPKWGFGTSPRELRSPTSTPGPGSYSLGQREGATRSAPKYSMGTRRSTNRSPETPGPGHYGGLHTSFGY